jgi:hypothetical protein
MKLSRLASLLNRELPVAEFTADLSAEFAIYWRGLSEVGRSAPVQVTEDEDLIVTADSIKTLCELFIDEELGMEVLAYIADVMQLADRVDFDEDWIADAVAEFTDPEVNGVFTKERAAEIAVAYTNQS